MTSLQTPRQMAHVDGGPERDAKILAGVMFVPTISSFRTFVSPGSINSGRHLTISIKVVSFTLIKFREITARAR